MPNLALPQLPSSPMFKAGVMTIEWQEFFRGLFERAGGSDSMNLNDVIVLALSQVLPAPAESILREEMPPGVMIPQMLPQPLQESDTPTWASVVLSSLTLGSVLFAGTGGLISEDNANFFWDDSNNRLGVGTASPDTSLHVAKANATAVIRLERIQSAISTDDIVGRIEVETQDTTDPGICAKLEAISRGASGETGWRFVGGVPSALIEFARFDEYGNLGLGTTEPDQKYHIEDVAGAIQRMTRKDTIVTADDIIGRFEFETQDAAAAGIAAVIQAIAEGSSGEVGISIQTGTGGSAVEAMRIRYNRNVGLGVATPTAVLHLKAGTATAGTGQVKFEEGTLLGTPEAGVLEFSNDRLYLTNVGTQRPIDRTSDVLTSTVTVTNTTVETTVYTAAISANDLKAGNIVKLHASGVLSNDSAADDITIRIYLGATAVVTFSPAIGNVTDEHWHMEGDMTVRTVGAPGTMAYHLDASIAGIDTEEIGIGNVDTTIAEDVTITFEWDNAKAGNTVSIYQGYMELKN